MRWVEFYCPCCLAKTPHSLGRMIGGDKVCMVCRAIDLEATVLEVLNSPYVLVGGYDFIEQKIEKAGMHE